MLRDFTVLYLLFSLKYPWFVSDNLPRTLFTCQVFDSSQVNVYDTDSVLTSLRYRNLSSSRFRAYQPERFQITEAGEKNQAKGKEVDIKSNTHLATPQGQSLELPDTATEME